MNHKDHGIGAAGHSERSARALLRAVLRLLFEQGVSRPTLEALCDEAYVEAAARQLRQEGRDLVPQDVASVSGVSLQEVERLRHILSRPSTSDVAPIRALAPLVDAATRVMTGWHADTDFTDDDGRPRPLQPESESFQRLVQRYGDGCSTHSISELLHSTDSVAVNDDDEMTPRGRLVLAAPSSEAIDQNALEAFLDLARAIDINRNKREAHSGALQRTCTNERIPARVAPLFKRMVRERTQDYLENIDDWLVQHEVHEDSGSQDEPLQRLGVGVYVICDS